MGNALTAKQPAEKLKDSIRQVVEHLKTINVTPTLKVIRAGEKESDIAYETGLTKTATALGIHVYVEKLPEDCKTRDVIDEIEEANLDHGTDGIIVLKPMPKQVSMKEVEQTILPRKDVDGMTCRSVYFPCTPISAVNILEMNGISVEGKHCVVIGRSETVGTPLAALLLNHNATVTVCHSKTVNVPAIAKTADILFVAAGKQELVTSEYTNPDQVIVDIGVHVKEDGTLVGDVAQDAIDTCGTYTPVKNGVGRLTTLTLLSHVVDSALHKNDYEH